MARIFIAEGLSLVIAMSFRVSVDAATKFMTEFYSSFFISGNGVGKAVYSAREILIQEKERRGRFGHRVALEDWIVPVVYKNSDDASMSPDLRFVASPVQERVIRRPATLFGRDREILDIEINLLQDKSENIMLLEGMAGVGKSYLIQYLSEWWTSTGLVERVVSIDFEEDIKSIDEICNAILSSPTPLEGEFEVHFPC